MFSNYNVLTLPITADGKHKVGDIFEVPDRWMWKFGKFHLLEIKNIDYCFGVRLHFDWNEWEDNIPVIIPVKKDRRFYE